jgi:hypothetical protein
MIGVMAHHRPYHPTSVFDSKFIEFSYNEGGQGLNPGTIGSLSGSRIGPDIFNSYRLAAAPVA